MLHMMVETYLLRGKRRLEKYGEVPALRTLGAAAVYALLGLVLSAAALWGRMLPLSLALVLGSGGWNALWASLGSMAGYRLFWGMEGFQGVFWVLGGLGIALLLPFFGEPRRGRLAAGAACVVSSVGLAWQYTMQDGTPTLFFLLRIALAAGTAALSRRMLTGRERLALWCGAGILVFAAAAIPLPRWCNPGLLAFGAVTAAAPLPVGILAGLGADLGLRTGIPLTAAAGLGFFFQQLPIRESWRRLASPALACGTVMLLEWKLDPQTLLAVSIGGTVGAMIPWQITAVPRHGSLGAAQVQLEQSARVLTGFQRQLLEYGASPPDETAILEALQVSACGNCALKANCDYREKVNLELLRGGGIPHCRKAGFLAKELERSRDTLKRIRAQRAVQEEYRTALVQQYGFLADVLHTLADRLPEREYRLRPQYRVQVSSRSKGKEPADGDRITAFPGLRSRYYVLLCDGMGTGLGAAEEGRQASILLRRMLTAGIPPASALGSINSQLTLLGRGGAVTVDLAEIRLDSGMAWVYKWGAAPSWLLHRGQAQKVGYATPPPGLDMKTPRAVCEKADLSRGQILVLASDGLNTDRVSEWPSLCTLDPPQLAERILQNGGSQEDDSTAVVIKLVSSK